VATDPADEIARTSLYGQRPGKERFEITVKFGRPYHSATGEWRCPVVVEPLIKLPDVCGEDSLQALTLALNLAREMLQDFKDKGGTLTWETGEEYVLEDSSTWGIPRSTWRSPPPNGKARAQ
jgi:hypothetical protein